MGTRGKATSGYGKGCSRETPLPPRKYYIEQYCWHLGLFSHTAGCVCTGVDVSEHVFGSVCACVLICVGTDVGVNVNIWVYLPVHVSACVEVCACMCVWVLVCVYWG